MQKRYKRLAAGLLTGTVLLSTGPMVLAKTDQDMQADRMQKIKKKIEDNGTIRYQLVLEINDIDRAAVETTNKINGLKAEIDKAKTNKVKIQRELDKIESEQSKTAKDLAKAKKQLEPQQKIVNDRAKGLYKHGETTYIDAILNSKNLSDFINRFNYLKMIFDQDARVLEKMSAAKRLVEDEQRQQREQERAAHTKQDGIDMQIKKTAELKAEQSQKIRDLDKQKAKKKALYTKLMKDRDGLLAMEAAEEAASISLAARLATAKIMSSRGASRAPVAGWVLPTTDGDTPITSGFGPRYAPTAGASSYHPGIDFGMYEGEPIVAANDGTVIEAGYAGGYGNLTVIDHGGGVTSAYGHQSSIAVSVGQQVRAGEVIGYVGSTGVSTGPHLHFEIRVDGEPQNPLNWYGG